MPGCYVHGNELSGKVNGLELLNCQALKKDCASLSNLLSQPVGQSVFIGFIISHLNG
jgi:hypothetical protein